MTGDAAYGALEPVRRALLDAARSTAAQTVRRAQAEAEQRLEAARADGEAGLARARKEAAADAAGVVRARRAAGRRAARSVVLTAQSQAYEDLATRARQAVRRELGTAQTNERLIAVARRTLGPQAAITADGVGAVVGKAGTTILELSLDELTDRALRDLGASGT